MQQQSTHDRPIVNKFCTPQHRHVYKGLTDVEMQSPCPECRRLSFRATLRARAATVPIPQYKGAWGLGGRAYARNHNGYKGLSKMVSASFAFPERIPGYNGYAEHREAHAPGLRGCDCLSCVTARVTEDRRKTA